MSCPHIKTGFFHTVFHVVDKVQSKSITDQSNITIVDKTQFGTCDAGHDKLTVVCNYAEIIITEQLKRSAVGDSGKDRTVA